jgi:hypothetical protein
MPPPTRVAGADRGDRPAVHARRVRRRDPDFSILAGDRFVTTNHLILTAQNVAVLTVMACGATFVLITAGFDLSVGSVAILGEVAAVTGGEVTPEIPADFVVATANSLEDPEINQYLYKEECD